MRIFWLILGLVSVACGLVGVVLPLLPTVPFLLLAAICFANSSPHLHHWLVTHQTFGPMIRDWQDSGAIRPGAKRLATLSVVLVFGLSLALAAPIYVLGLQAVVLSGVMIFIWTRPDS